MDREPQQTTPWVRVEDAQGKTLGFGQHNPKSQIRVRLWTFGESIPDFKSILADRLTAAQARRAALLRTTDAVRYVNSEGDFVPGIILDKYAGVLVLQLLTEGVERIREPLIDTVRSIFDEPTLYEKSVGRTEEELPDRAGVVYGNPIPATLQIRNGCDHFGVDIQSGHKTGFYLDQRHNIRLLRDFFSERQPGGSRLLDGFCYSGAFGVSLRKYFDHVTFVDGSNAGIQLCRKNWEDNGGKAGDFICRDVFDYLREPSVPFDAIILDPPSFAKRKNEVEGACRGYKDLQRLAMKNIRPEGILAAFSCSHHITPDLFQKVAFAAAIDAGRRAQILARFGPDTDHPVSIDHPEGDYLKGLLLRVI